MNSTSQSQSLSPIFLILLGIIIKIYDDSVDNNLKYFQSLKEYFKPAIYIFSYLALIGDLQLTALVTTAFAGAPHQDLADDDFWYPLGLMTVCILIYNFFYSEFNISLFSLLIFTVFGGLIYAESRIITEEYSWRKLIMRILALPLIALAYYFIDSPSVRKGLFVGGGYVAASIIMMAVLQWDFFSGAVDARKNLIEDSSKIE
jgi:hypothetical protein